MKVPVRNPIPLTVQKMIMTASQSKSLFDAVACGLFPRFCPEGTQDARMLKMFQLAEIPEIVAVVFHS